MTTINHPSQYQPAANVDGPATSDPHDRPSAQLILDGVIASYIHDISQRHRNLQLNSDRLAVPGAGSF